MILVVKRTVSLRWFFLRTQANVSSTGRLEKILNFTLIFVSNRIVSDKGNDVFMSSCLIHCYRILLVSAARFRV